MTAQLYAHYFTGTLIVGSSMSPVGTTYTVVGKRAARALAAKLGATPWNF